MQCFHGFLFSSAVGLTADSKTIALRANTMREEIIQLLNSFCPYRLEFRSLAFILFELFCPEIFRMLSCTAPTNKISRMFPLPNELVVKILADTSRKTVSALKCTSSTSYALVGLYAKSFPKIAVDYFIRLEVCNDHLIYFEKF